MCFRPTVVADYGDILAAASHGEASLAKIVGVSDDLELVARVADEARELIGHRASVTRSLPYYVDVTRPDANKGAVVDDLCHTLGIPPAEFCTFGDMPTDVLMFARSCLSIAMGNADRDPQRAARHVTRPNTGNGFVHAMERYVLPAQAEPHRPQAGRGLSQRIRRPGESTLRVANRPPVSTRAWRRP